MSGTQSPTGKQRTRAHVIADLSHNFVERFILEEGHTAQRWQSDYGYDLLMTTHDANGHVEPGLVYWQLKASEEFAEGDGFVPFDLDVRDYGLWIRERPPVILCLYSASERKACFLHVQAYFRENPSRRPKPAAKTVRVRVPLGQTVNRRAIRRIRLLKEEFATSFNLRVIP